MVPPAPIAAPSSSSQSSTPSPRAATPPVSAPEDKVAAAAAPPAAEEVAAAGEPADAAAAAADADSALNRLSDWQQSLIYVNNSEGILELRAGAADELIVLATQSTNRDFVFQDAFLLTYRTFISTLDLLCKLQHRFRRFNREGETLELRAARSAFSLMVSTYECYTWRWVGLTYMVRAIDHE